MKITELPEMKIIYMRRTGAYGPENQYLMNTFKAWLKENDLFNEETTIVGIAQDNPEIVVPEKCRYDIGLIVNKFIDIDDPKISKAVICSGNYAVFTVAHTSQTMAQFWQKLFKVLAESNLIMAADRPIIERYQYKLVMNDLCEFCVPIQ